MSLVKWHLKNVEATDIRKTIGNIRHDIIETNGHYSRPLNSNTVVLDYENTSPEQLKDRLALFASESPGKLFYLTNTDFLDLSLVLGKKQQLSLSDKHPIIVGISEINKNSKRPLLSEVFIISLKYLSSNAALSLVLAHLNVGFRPLLTVFGRCNDNALLKALSSESTAIIFSSSDFSENMNLLPQELVNFTGELIDLEWLALSNWRNCLRDISIRYNLTQARNLLKYIKISGTFDTIPLTRGNSATRIVPSRGLCIFCGWLLVQLNTQVKALGRSGYECSGEMGTMPFSIKLCPVNSIKINESQTNNSETSLKLNKQQPSPVNEIIFDFSLMEGENQNHYASISINNDDKFDSFYFENGKEYRSKSNAKSTRKLAFDLKTEDLKLAGIYRYLVRGESTRSYIESIKKGQELYELAFATFSYH